MRSVNVVFPESMWALIPMFRNVLWVSNSGVDSKAWLLLLLLRRRTCPGGA